MRKHSVRKWIHAILDMLPLVVIPIFAIYSHRHQIDTYTVVREEPYTVNAYQSVLNGKPIDYNYWSFDYVESYEIDTHDDNLIITCYEDDEFEFYPYINLHVSVGDKIYFTHDFDFFDVNFLSSLRIYFTDGDRKVLDINDNVVEVNGKYLVTSNIDADFTYVDYYGYCDDTGGSFTPEFFISNVQVFNLTSIFGSGNEPSLQEFDNWLNGRYLDYGNNEVSYGNRTVTYNDTDIGSQFVYQLYNVTDKYFNFNSVGNFHDIYGWFETNLFNGSAPMSFFIVWNIILYEFIMDLIFLTYMLFMFIIDFAEHMIDCFFDKSYRGGR